MRSKADNTKLEKSVHGIVCHNNSNHFPAGILLPFALRILLRKKKYVGHCLEQRTLKILDLKFALQRIIMSYRFSESVWSSFLLFFHTVQNISHDFPVTHGNLVSQSWPKK